MSPAVTKRGAWRQGVGYVKKNFLHGLELTDFSTIHAAAQVPSSACGIIAIRGAFRPKVA
jgi:hypothetical protein